MELIFVKAAQHGSRSTAFIGKVLGSVPRFTLDRWIESSTSIQTSFCWIKAIPTHLTKKGEVGNKLYIVVICNPTHPTTRSWWI
jgi:hypothetical protein